MCNCNVKPVYMGMDVQISGLDKQWEVGEVADRVHKALMQEFGLVYDHDVDVDVVEHAP
jgi:hypothetical protein